VNALSALTARILRTRRLVRAPMYLYRFGFGFVFGHRMLLLEHRGRRSGLPHHTVLEVVEHPTPDTYVIVSGFGEASQWYRNLIADPRVRISVGRGRNAPAVATLLAPDAAETSLAHYAAEHPRTWNRLRRTLEKALHTDDLRLPMFAIQLSSTSEQTRLSD
jgi:deazaflavin-dependent oxidoreductase (nitroreductase family)